MTVRTFDETRCTLGEGPFWAEGRLWWFDILEKHMFARAPHAARAERWDFDEHFSAGAPLTGGELLLASETALWRFDPETSERTHIAALESGDPATRSNDGRADPLGGFWIGTMGKAAEPGRGAIYRYYRGELRRLVENVTVSNAICFAPDGSRGYFANSPTRTIMTWSLDEDGWPREAAKPFFTFNEDEGFPDGATVDADGALWVAMWSGARVARITADGVRAGEVALPAPKITCPTFGGEPSSLYVTSACKGGEEDAAADEPLSGATFVVDVEVPGPDAVPSVRED